MIYARTNPLQLLSKHLQNVADKAAEFTKVFGAEEWGRQVGLWHDIGKASKEFQQYLLDGITPERGYVDHKFAAAIAAKQAGWTPLCLMFMGHHGAGLPNVSTVKKRIDEETTDEKLEIVKQYSPVVKLQPPPFCKDKKSSEFFIRMVFSALIDADRLDAEASGSQEKAAVRKYSVAMSDLLATFIENQKKFKPDSDVNKLRDSLYQAAVKMADETPGLFSFTAPTGSGKTRSALAFALHHAIKHGMRRIIVVMPYMSITDQTAQEYRKIFGDDIVVEHHSSVEKETEFNRLACENWDAPIVVTTSVQFLESLHGHSSAQCRKIHNIANSVVIFDEVQVLPTQVVEPTLDIINELVTNYNVSLILSTATQPAFKSRQGFEGLDNVREITPDAVKLFDARRRVKYHILTDTILTHQDIASQMLELDQVLCVVNSRSDATKIYEQLGIGYHLSASMCPAHRLDVIRRIKDNLAAGKSCRVVSTQLVEAGVDIDFPVVYRAFGPLDSIIQAAGRCNREGKLGYEGGHVYVFRLKDGHMPPGAYKLASDQTDAMIRRGVVDPYSAELVDDYFKLLYKMSDLDSAGVISCREIFDYPAVADKYKLIAENTTPMIVNYGDSKKLKEAIVHAENIGRELWRQAQRYSVSLYPYQLAAASGLYHEARDGIWFWDGMYDDEMGLIIPKSTTLVI